MYQRIFKLSILFLIEFENKIHFSTGAPPPTAVGRPRRLARRTPPGRYPPYGRALLSQVMYTQEYTQECTQKYI